MVWVQNIFFKIQPLLKPLEKLISTQTTRDKKGLFLTFHVVKRVHSSTQGNHLTVAFTPLEGVEEIVVSWFRKTLTSFCEFQIGCFFSPCPPPVCLFFRTTLTCWPVIKRIFLPFYLVILPRKPVCHFGDFLQTKGKRNFGVKVKKFSSFDFQIIFSRTCGIKSKWNCSLRDLTIYFSCFLTFCIRHVVFFLKKRVYSYLFDCWVLAREYQPSCVLNDGIHWCSGP